METILWQYNEYYAVHYVQLSKTVFDWTESLFFNIVHNLILFKFDYNVMTSWDGPDALQPAQACTRDLLACNA